MEKVIAQRIASDAMMDAWLVTACDEEFTVTFCRIPTPKFRKRPE